MGGCEQGLVWVGLALSQKAGFKGDLQRKVVLVASPVCSGRKTRQCPLPPQGASPDPVIPLHPVMPQYSQFDLPIYRIFISSV